MSKELSGEQLRRFKRQGPNEKPELHPPQGALASNHSQASDRPMEPLPGGHEYAALMEQLTVEDLRPLSTLVYHLAFAYVSAPIDDPILYQDEEYIQPDEYRRYSNEDIAVYATDAEYSQPATVYLERKMADADFPIPLATALCDLACRDLAKHYLPIAERQISEAQAELATPIPPPPSDPRLAAPDHEEFVKLRRAQEVERAISTRAAILNVQRLGLAASLQDHIDLRHTDPPGAKLLRLFR